MSAAVAAAEAICPVAGAQLDQQLARQLGPELGGMALLQLLQALV